MERQQKSRDPRFDPLCGNFNQDLFKKSFNFINGYKKTELTMLQKAMYEEKNKEEREQLKDLYQRQKSKLMQEEKDERKMEQKRRWKKEELELVRQGKRPFHLNRKQEKKMELIDKFEKAKKSGNSEKTIAKIVEKKRKSAITRKMLPRTRLH